MGNWMIILLVAFVLFVALAIGAIGRMMKDQDEKNTALLNEVAAPLIKQAANPAEVAGLKVRMDKLEARVDELVNAVELSQTELNEDLTHLGNEYVALKNQMHAINRPLPKTMRLNLVHYQGGKIAQPKKSGAAQGEKK